MTTKGFPDIGFILYGGYDIMPQIMTLSDETEAILEDVTPPGVAYDEWAYVGQTMWVFNLEGFYNSGDTVEAITLTGEQILMWAEEGNAVGDPVLAATVQRKVRSKRPARGTLHKIAADFVAAAGPDRCLIVAPHTTRTASSGQTATLDNAASSANGAVGYAECTNLDLDGATNLLLKLRDSTDDIVFADLISFTAITAAPAAERLTVAGTVNRYVHMDWAYTGSPGGSVTNTSAVILKRN